MTSSPLSESFMLDGSAVEGDANESLEHEASRVGGRVGPDAPEGTPLAPSAATQAGISLLGERAVLAVAHLLTSCAQHLGTTRANHSADAPPDAAQLAASAPSFTVILSGNISGVQVVLWGCIAVLISILAMSAIFLSLQYQRQSPHGDAVSRQVMSDPMHGLLESRGRRGVSHSDAGSVISNAQRSAAKSCTSLATSNALSSCERISTTSTYRTQGVASMLPGLPLCPLLIVPEGTRLACIVQNDLRRRKQELCFDIGAVPARGGAPLFRVRVSELSTEAPGIYVETLSGREQLAVLSTAELWRGAENPSLSISRPWGLPYGTIQKGENGEYHVMRGNSTLLVIGGDFENHSIRVRNSSDNTVATVMQASPEEYQVHMQARTDAGLIILGLLAVDKCEILSEPAPRCSSDTQSEEPRC